MICTDHVFGHPYEKHGSSKVWKVRTISSTKRVHVLWCFITSFSIRFLHITLFLWVLIEIFAIQTININGYHYSQTTVIKMFANRVMTYLTISKLNQWIHTLCSMSALHSDLLNIILFLVNSDKKFSYPLLSFPHVMLHVDWNKTPLIIQKIRWTVSLKIKLVKYFEHTSSCYAFRVGFVFGLLGLYL